MVSGPGAWPPRAARGRSQPCGNMAEDRAVRNGEGRGVSGA